MKLKLAQTVEIRPPYRPCSNWIAAQVAFVRRGKRREFREVSERQLERLINCLADMGAELTVDAEALAHGEFIVLGILV